MNASEEIIIKSLDKFEKRVYQSKIELIYKGHIPLVAFYVLRGSLKLKFSAKKIKEVTSGEFIALENLIKNIPLEFTVIAQKDSQVAILDRSTLNEEKNKLIK